MRLKSSLIIIASLIAIVLIIVFSPIGLKIGAHFVSEQAPGELNYKQVTGTIFGPYIVKNLDYQYAGNHLHINKLYFSWRSLNITKHKLKINKISADGVTWITGGVKIATGDQLQKIIEEHLHKAKKIQTKQQSPATTTAKDQAPSTALPWDIEIKQAALTDVTVKKADNKNPLYIPKANLNMNINSKKVSANLAISFLKPETAHINMTLSGTPNSYQFLSNITSPESNLSITGQGNKKQFKTNNFSGPLFSGRLSGQLKIQWQNTSTWWQLSLNAAKLKADEMLGESFPRLISAKLNIKQQDNLNVDLHQFDATWENGKRLDGSVHFKYHSKLQKPVLNNILIDLKSQNSYLKVQGDYADKIKLTYAGKVPNIKLWLPKYHGQIITKGRIFGPREKPLLSGTVNAINLRHHLQSIKNITAKWKFDLSNQSPAHFKVSLHKIIIAPLLISNAKFSFNGTKLQHKITAFIENDDARFNLATSGGFNQGLWNGIVNKFNISWGKSSTFHLKSPATLSLNQNQWDLQPTCWTSKQGSICANSNKKINGHWQTNINASDINLGIFNSLIAEKFKLDTDGSLTLHSSGINKDIKQWQLHATMSQGKLNYISADDKPLNLNFDDSDIYSQLSKGKITSTLKIKLKKSGFINSTINLHTNKIDIKNLATQTISGKLVVSSKNLSPLAIFIPPALQTKGGVDMNCQLSGTVSKPMLSGSVKLSNGEIILPKLGITLKNITILGNANNNKMDYTASLSSGGRKLYLKGSAMLMPHNFSTTATLDGSNVLIWDTPSYTLYASPKLKIRVNNRDFYMDGTLTIPRGEIQPPSFYNVTTLPDDTIIIRSGEKIKKESYYRVHMNINVIAKPKIKFKAVGFDTNLYGKLNIIHQPNKKTLAIGAINTKQGTYIMRGKTFILESGALKFNNTPIVNPSLDVEAYRVIHNYSSTIASAGIETITVGFHVTGDLRKPSVTLFSRPVALSQANILSYILVGYPSNNHTGSENLAIVASGLSSLSLDPSYTQEPSITERLYKTLHIDELGFDRASVADPVLGTTIYQDKDAFTVGTHLTSRIYLRYQQNSGLHGDRAQLRYSINHNWGLQTNYSQLGYGGDVLYSFQRK